MTFWRWLLNPCLLGHASWHRDRVAGQLVKRCDRCQQPMGAMLAGEMLTTPLPQTNAGAVTTKAKRVTRPNVVTPMRRSER